MIDFLIYAGMAVLSFVVSTLFIGWGIPHLRKDERSDASETSVAEARRKRVFDWASAGLWIGVCEILIVFPLVCYGEFGALAIIFGAKEYVRKEKIQKDPAHYLLGTLVNLSIAILFALWAKSLAGTACGPGRVVGPFGF